MVMWSAKLTCPDAKSQESMFECSEIQRGSSLDDVPPKPPTRPENRDENVRICVPWERKLPVW